MDDLVILDNDLNRLKDILKIISKEINKLELKVNDKSNIFKLSRGFSFLGYTFIINNRLIIKINNHTYRRIKKHLRMVNYNVNSLVSYKGFFNRCKL